MIKQIDYNKIPVILGNITKVVKTITPDILDTCIMAILLPMISHVISFKRIKVDEFNDGKNIKHINVYCIVLMVSGGGKDRIKMFLEKHVLKSSLAEIDKYTKIYYQKKLQDLENKLEKTKSKIEKHKITAEISKLREVDLIINKSTQEGFLADAQAVSEMESGAILVLDSEVGLTLIAKDEKQRQIIESLIHGFDGILPTKSIKMENTKYKRVLNLVVNALLYSDPQIFKGKKLQELFESMLEQGIARRSFITFQDTLIKRQIENPELEYVKIQQAYKDCENLDSKIFEIFNSIPNNAVYKLPKEVAIKCFYPYKRKLTDLFNSAGSGLEGKEYLSREFKALKLAALCACLNHPKDLIIHDTDFEQGIYLTEFLSQDYKSFLDFSSPYNDHYVKVYEFLKQNLNKTFYKTDLINCHKKMELSRGFFRREFNEIIDGVKEMATVNGYYLEAFPLEKNNAYTYTFRKILTQKEIDEQNKNLMVDTI